MHHVYDSFFANHVFTRQHPGECGYDAEAGVTLEWELERLDLLADWRDGDDRALVLGRSADRPSRFQVFASAGECRDSGYSPLDGNVCFVPFGRWEEYFTPERAALRPPAQG